MKNPISYIFLALIKLYQTLISPFTAPSCRFYPTCSHYSYTAIERFGPFKGLWLSVKRISKCHPWHEGGHDPVPEHESH